MQRQDLLSAAGITVIGILLGVKLLLPGIQAAQAKQASLNTEIATLQRDVASRPAEEARAQKLQADYEKLRNGLPDNEGFDEVLADLQEAARLLSVTTGRISRSVQASTIQGVTAVNLDIQVEGTYPRVQALIQTISHLPRAYRTQGITLTGSKEGTVRGTLKLTTYKRDIPNKAESTPATTPSTSPLPAGDKS